MLKKGSGEVAGEGLVVLPRMLEEVFMRVLEKVLARVL